MEDIAGEVAGLIGREEERGVRDVDRLAHAPHRNLRVQALLRGFGRELHERAEIGLDEPGADRVDSDPRAHELARELLRDEPHAGLGRAVGQRSGVGMLGADRSDGDEAGAVGTTAVDHRADARL